ncbi:MAG TPA: DegT/DnrJ/EryC1/StrS aminotransferase family protein, partial [Candidatus Nanoarchaeia archaeon]|nr:DegT/DnrJ/EryC1/StrS aminotransferase family protein [Candidatus Nanoarchaeia archaeon]
MTLKSLTGKDAIIIVDRGNTAIFHSLEIAKKLGKTQVVIQDQGAWLVYKQYPKKIGLELIVLKTDYGLIDAKTLAASIDKDSALLITSMAGYIAVQDMDAIYNICKKK